MLMCSVLSFLCTDDVKFANVNTDMHIGLTQHTSFREYVQNLFAIQKVTYMEQHGVNMV